MCGAGAGDGLGWYEVWETLSSSDIVCSGGFCRASSHREVLPGNYYGVLVTAYNQAAAAREVQSFDLYISEDSVNNLLIKLLLPLVLCFVALLCGLYFIESYAPPVICE